MDKGTQAPGATAYDRVTCYFHSGTGNSFRTARWLAETAAAKGTTANVIPISDAQPREDLKPGPSQLVGLYHPTHGFMPPWSMIKFLFQMPRGRGAHAMVVATRGAYPLGRVVVPGAAGMALFFPLLVLLLKGYRVKGGMGIDMPANLINVHWGFKPENVEHVMAWGRRRHERLADAVLKNRFYLHPKNVIWELAWCFPFVLWPLYPVIYLLIGRVFMAKLMFSDTTCKGCGRCARNCPSQAISMVGPKPKTPFWTHHCEVCMRCMGYCKYQAVQASHLWVVPVIYATSFITAALVQRWFAGGLGLELGIGLAYELIAILLTFAALPLLYYVFWGLQRLRPLRKLFAYTTLTKYYSRRYHAPNTAPREMNRRSEIKSA